MVFIHPACTGVHDPAAGMPVITTVAPTGTAPARTAAAAPAAQPAVSVVAIKPWHYRFAAQVLGFGAPRTGVDLVWVSLPPELDPLEVPISPDGTPVEDGGWKGLR